MANQTRGLHHYHLRKRLHQNHETYPHPDKFKRFYDKLIYIVVILTPIANIPQLFKVWIEKNASGLSAVSWFLFSGISITWLIYGILHKDKHILIMNAALMIIQALVAIGAVMYGGSFF